MSIGSFLPGLSKLLAKPEKHTKGSPRMYIENVVTIEVNYMYFE